MGVHVLCFYVEWISSMGSVPRRHLWQSQQCDEAIVARPFAPNHADNRDTLDFYATTDLNSLDETRAGI